MESAYNDSHNDYQFCSGEDNINDCVSYMNQELQVHGFQALQASTDNLRDLTTQLLNRLYALLQQHCSDLKFRKDLQDKLLRSNSDMQIAQRSQTLHKEELDKSLRENQSINEHNRQLEDKIKVLNGKLKVEKDELKKSKSNLQYIKNQQKKEMNKMEKISTKLKERLNSFMTDKSQARKADIDVINMLQNASGKRAVWKTKSKDDEEMHQALTCSYENKIKDLIMENTAFRDFANTMYKNLLKLQWKSEGKFELADATDENIQQLNPEILPDGIFQLPLEMSRDAIDTALQDTWDNLDKTIMSSLKQNMPNQNLAVDVNEMDHLKSQLQESLMKLSERDELIHALQNAQNDIKNDNHVMNESVLCMEKEEVENLKAELQKQKESLEKERNIVAEAALTLNQQRKEFENERLALLEAQIGSSPMALQKSGDLSTPAAGNINCERYKIKTPTTSEFYQFINNEIATRNTNVDSGVEQSPNDDVIPANECHISEQESPKNSGTKDCNRVNLFQR